MNAMLRPSLLRDDWTNLARDPRFSARKSDLARFLATSDHPDISGSRD
jgi:hypothetical protein